MIDLAADQDHSLGNIAHAARAKGTGRHSFGMGCRQRRIAQSLCAISPPRNARNTAKAAVWSAVWARNHDMDSEHRIDADPYALYDYLHSLSAGNLGYRADLRSRAKALFRGDGSRLAMGKHKVGARARDLLAAGDEPAGRRK